MQHLMMIVMMQEMVIVKVDSKVANIPVTFSIPAKLNEKRDVIM